MMNIIIVDSDALIALFNRDDAHAEKAERFFELLLERKARLIYPVTTFIETVDTLQRKLKKQESAARIAQLISEAEFATESIEVIDGDCLKEAVRFFKSGKSNTLADGVVAAVAKKYKADAIFSFDKWYTKQGFVLLEDFF